MLILLSIASNVIAFPITRIAFRGNSHLQSDRLQQAVIAPPSLLDRDYRTRSELLIALQESQRRIEMRYKLDGYIFAHTDSSSIAQADPVDSVQGYAITFWLTEGLRYTIDTIAVGGASAENESTVRNLIETHVGDVLEESLLKADIQAILTYYSRTGRPFAKVEVERIDLDTIGERGGMRIYLNVDEGGIARIGKIIVEGNTTTSRDVIVRELGIAPGALYDPVEIERSRSRLERLGYFESVSEPDLYLLTDSTVALVVRVREANTSQIDGVLGYNPARSQSEQAYISGLLELSFRNISGTGRDAALHYSRETSLSQVLEVRYLEPWLFGYPLDLIGSFSQRQQDSSYTRTFTNGALQLALRDDLGLEVSAGLERIIPTDLANYAFSAYDSKSIVYGLSGLFDSRDNAAAPRSGVRAMLGATYAVKAIYGPSRFIDSVTPVAQAVRTAALDCQAFHTLFSPRFVGMAGVHARIVTKGQGLLDESDLFRIGGFQSIRGYREAELVASRFAYGTAELRFMTARQSFFFGFLDGGVLFRDSTKSLTSEQVLYPFSYGLGIQLESPLGLISVSIALPKGEALDQAKLHFGLVKQF